ncbi:MAG: hypothetical protein JRJ21_08170 [Deltaproteobacteria bacterium]|nr:hypothetical protein [Deltaproteobacteria bacterium]
MNTGMRIVLVVMIGFALTVGIGCAPTLVSVSNPEIQTAGNPYYDARLEPLSRGRNFFVVFRLTVTNRTDKNLEIDWNKTRYVYNGSSRGVFVFKGIKPEDIKNLTIPPDIIPARGTFSKEISPYRLIARAPIREGSSERGIYSGLLPKGENGIRLLVRQNGKEIVEQITVNIVDKEFGK